MSDAQRKENIVELLRLLGSEEEQLAYERNVPHVDITVELVSMWFDDFCHGHAPKADGIFTTEEHAALTHFHEFYDARVDRLPESRGTVRTWLEAPVWREVMQEARMTLARMTV